MRQVEVSRTIVFGHSRHARGFFEALPVDNLDVGRPEEMQVSSVAESTRHHRRDTGPGCCAPGTRSPSTPTSGTPG